MLVADHLPDIGQMVWLHENGRTWIGSRDDGGDGWMWGNSYGHIWHNGEQWDGDCEQDDDYSPTHWMPLPTPPNVPALAQPDNQNQPSNT